MLLSRALHDGLGRRLQFGDRQHRRVQPSRVSSQSLAREKKMSSGVVSDPPFAVRGAGLARQFISSGVLGVSCKLLLSGRSAKLGSQPILPQSSCRRGVICANDNLLICLIVGKFFRQIHASRSGCRHPMHPQYASRRTPRVRHDKPASELRHMQMDDWVKMIT